MGRRVQHDRAKHQFPERIPLLLLTALKGRKQITKCKLYIGSSLHGAPLPSISGWHGRRKQAAQPKLSKLAFLINTDNPVSEKWRQPGHGIRTRTSSLDWITFKTETQHQTAVSDLWDGPETLAVAGIINYDYNTTHSSNILVKHRRRESQLLDVELWFPRESFFDHKGDCYVVLMKLGLQNLPLMMGSVGQQLSQNI